LKFYEKIDIGGFAMRGNLIDHISVARFLRSGEKIRVKSFERSKFQILNKVLMNK
jgi:hypothetical protein